MIGRLRLSVATRRKKQAKRRIHVFINLLFQYVTNIKPYNSYFWLFSYCIYSFSSSDTDNLLALLSVCKFAKNVHYDQILKYYALLYFFYFLVHIFAQNNCKNIVFVIFTSEKPSFKFFYLIVFSHI